MIIKDVHFVLECTMINEVGELIDYKNPKEGRIHNWWNYVPDGLQEVWHDLGEEAQIVASIIAGVQANGEEWD